jgi:hypothetical protein
MSVLSKAELRFITTKLMFGSEKWTINVGHKKILEAQHLFLTVLSGLTLKEHVHKEINRE